MNTDKNMRRAVRRQHAERKRINNQKSYAARTKGLMKWDDEECRETIYKRDDREQTGRRRLEISCCGGAARRLKVDAETLEEALSNQT